MGFEKLKLLFEDILAILDLSNNSSDFYDILACLENFSDGQHSTIARAWLDRIIFQDS